MASFTITAEDTLTLYGRVFNDFADADASTITFPNDMVTMKSGKNKNTIFAKNATGDNGELTLRLIRGSSDDRFMRGKLLAAEQDFASVELASGEFVKRLGDGQGNVMRDVYTLAGGVIVRKVETKENTDGDTEQGVAVYNMRFATITSTIQ